MFRTGHGIVIEFHDIPDSLLRFYNRCKEMGVQCSIIVGTDSQNFSETKFVSVIAAVSEGRGGIFFYEISHKAKIKDIRVKLHQEVQDSLMLADSLIEMIMDNPKYSDMFMNCPISIHVDAGNAENCKTKVLIPELVGWIKSCGYEAQIKPEAFVASSIADKLSK